MRIKTAITLIILLVLLVFTGAAAFWFHEDSQTLYTIKEEVNAERAKVQQVVDVKETNFQISDNLKCELVTRLIELEVGDMAYPTYQKLDLDITSINSEQPNILLSFVDQEKEMTFNDFTKLDKTNSIIFERHSDAGETNTLTVVKDTGFVTFFSTSQTNSIATEATGYCHSN